MMSDKFTKTVPALTAAAEKTQTQVTATVEKTLKTAQEMAAFGKGNLDAFIASGQIWAAGVQDLSKSFMASAKEQMDQAVEAVNAFAAVKSFVDFAELQAAFVRTSLDKAITETNKLTDASTKLATDVLAPLTARVTLAAEAFGRAV
jgi:phasin family protein